MGTDKTGPIREQSAEDSSHDIFKASFSKYGINKPHLFDAERISGLKDYFFWYGKMILDLAVKQTFEKEDLWKLPEAWSSQSTYPALKKYFMEKYNDPKNKDGTYAIFLKHVKNSLLG